MKFRSIRARLTAWYLSMLALGLAVFGVGSWFAMRASAFHTIDEELEDRIRGVRKFMQIQIASLSQVEIRDEFRDHSVLGPGGDLFRLRREMPAAIGVEERRFERAAEAELRLLAGDHGDGQMVETDLTGDALQPFRAAANEVPRRIDESEIAGHAVRILLNARAPSSHGPPRE